MAAKIALTCYKGEDYEADGTHVSSDDATTAQPVDITGWTIVFTVRAAPGTSGSPLLGPVECTLVSAPAGTYKVTLTSAQTAALGVGSYWCDFWRTNSGAQTELAIGTFKVRQGVNQ